MPELKGRFIDVQVIEGLNTPMVQLDVDWRIWDGLKTSIKSMQEKWFGRKPTATQEDSDDIYYLVPKDI